MIIRITIRSMLLIKNFKNIDNINSNINNISALSGEPRGLLEAQWRPSARSGPCVSESRSPNSELHWLTASTWSHAARSACTPILGVSDDSPS